MRLKFKIFLVVSVLIVSYVLLDVAVEYVYYNIFDYYDYIESEMCPYVEFIKDEQTSCLRVPVENDDTWYQVKRLWSMIHCACGFIDYENYGGYL